MRNSSSKIWSVTSAQQLSEALAAIDDLQIMRNFLCDVMTEKEIAEISTRFEAARMLQSGKKYTEIIEKTKLSSRTIARISDWMKNGKGGYAAALKITAVHHDHLSPARTE